MNVVAAHSKSDSWLLYAVLHASKDTPAERNRIVAVADHYNHAVLTNDELEGGLKRLVDQGWVKKEGFTFLATWKANQAYSWIQTENLNCFDEMKRMQTLLEN